jgi:hypothetical protein
MKCIQPGLWIVYVFDIRKQKLGRATFRINIEGADTELEKQHETSHTPCDKQY